MDMDVSMENVLFEVGLRFGLQSVSDAGLLLRLPPLQLSLSLPEGTA